jgi:hypothetical protein
MLVFIGVCPLNYHPNNDRDGGGINEMSELGAQLKMMLGSRTLVYYRCVYTSLLYLNTKEIFKTDMSPWNHLYVPKPCANTINLSRLLPS